MTQQERVERMAAWLNGLCVDWPPLSYDWNSRHAVERRKQMRELAKTALGIADGKLKHGNEQIRRDE